MRKRTFGYVRPTKTQISLGIHAVWSKSLLSAWGKLGILDCPLPIEDSDQTGRMRMLIWIFVWCTCSKVCFLTFRLIFSVITKTWLYNFDPLKPHFYIVKLGFTGVYIFLFLLENIDCWYSLEPPRQGGSNEYPQYMFWAEMKISEILSENFQFLVVKFSIYLNRRVFVMFVIHIDQTVANMHFEEGLVHDLALEAGYERLLYILQTTFWKTVFDLITALWA